MGFGRDASHSDVRFTPKSGHRVYYEVRQEGRRTPITGGKVADLTANLSRRGSIRVDVSIDRVAPYGGEQRVESCLAPGESGTGKRQNLRGRDASGDGPRRTRAHRSARSHGRRGGIVRRLAQPHVDRASCVLLTEVEVRLIDELRTDDRRSDSVGEPVGQLIGDLALLLVDLERELAVPGTKDGADSSSGPTTSLNPERSVWRCAPFCAEPVAEIMRATSVTDSERHRINVFIPTSPYYLFCAVDS